MPKYTLETIIVILILLWLLGWLIIPAAGNLVHLILVIVLVVVIVRLVQGKRPLP
ncbi:MAG: lmo0937 family membrane protein [Zavarzinella sp.]